MPKEPTRQQLSSRLAYNAQTPAFLLRLQRQVTGKVDDDDDDGEFEDLDDSGRPPIPRRPAIPQRPDDDPGSADEEDGEEKPQIIVLREGKHLSEREVENEKRIAKGLPPLPEPQSGDKGPSSSGSNNAAASSSQSGSGTKQSLSFSSSKVASGGPIAKKRKAVEDGKAVEDSDGRGRKQKAGSKKPKKAEKKLLSFDEDA